MSTVSSEPTKDRDPKAGLSHDVAGRSSRFTAYALLIVVVWLIVAAAATLTMPQLERVVETRSKSFAPADSTSSIAEQRAAEVLGEPATNNINYVLLERDQPLNEADRQYYERLVAALRADIGHVGSLTDLWSDPVTAVAAQSADARAVTVRMRLVGMIGTSQASGSVSAVRDTMQKMGPPDGLRVYLTGPGATVADEFSAIDRQMLRIVFATIGLILVLLLVVYRSPVGAAIPLLSVGLAIAVARPIVAALGDAGFIEV